MNKYPVVKILTGKLKVDSEVKICGWIKNKRDSKIGISFIDLYDGSCPKVLQIIANKKLNNYKKEILKITVGCSIKVIGILKRSQGKNQYYELQANSIKVLGWIKHPESYPISSKYHSMEFLREHAHLRPRTNLIGSISRIRNYLMFSIHKFMYKNGFLWVPTPIITSYDTEGNSKMFKISNYLSQNNVICNKNKSLNNNFFGHNAFLTVSGQLNVETYSCALSNVYTFGPVFRAENSNTKKHLSEFWMVEPEISFADLNEVIRFSLKMLKYLVKFLLKHCIEDIEFIQKIRKTKLVNKLNKFIINDIIQIEYTEAIDILKCYNSYFKNNVYWGMDLSSEHENFLINKYFLSSILIKNHPKDIKAFYMRINNDNKTVASMDILMPNIGEIIGGSQREERLEKLDCSMLKKIDDKKISHYWWYRDLRKYGTVIHSGFGLGFERLMLFLTDMPNIRDVIPFPRVPGNIKF